MLKQRDFKNSDFISKTTNEVENVIKEADRYIDKYRRNIFARFPILFSFLVTFGVICVWYGFDALIGTIPFLANRPIVVLLIGILILVFTGTLYKKLSQSERDL